MAFVTQTISKMLYYFAQSSLTTLGSSLHPTPFPTIFHASRDASTTTRSSPLLPLSCEILLEASGVLCQRKVAIT
jgi:hypothetical protein